MTLKQVNDEVNPLHYKQGDVECINAIESATINLSGSDAYLVGNIIKYVWRYQEKNGVKDLRKANWYLERLIKNKTLE
jgi:hypothetical protein